MADRSGLSESMEDYLEAIFHLTEDKGFARVKDIARRLKVHMPSVTGALQTLSARRLVNYEPYSVVTLTPEGATLARSLVGTHTALRTFLQSILGLPEQEADENACRMEHAISRQTRARLIEFIEFVEQAPQRPRDWLREFADSRQGRSRKPRKGTRQHERRNA